MQIQVSNPVAVLIAISHSNQQTRMQCEKEIEVIYYSRALGSETYFHFDCQQINRASAKQKSSSWKRFPWLWTFFFSFLDKWSLQWQAQTETEKRLADTFVLLFVNYFVANEILIRHFIQFVQSTPDIEQEFAPLQSSFSYQTMKCFGKVILLLLSQLFLIESYKILGVFPTR